MVNIDVVCRLRLLSRQFLPGDEKRRHDRQNADPVFPVFEAQSRHQHHERELRYQDHMVDQPRALESHDRLRPLKGPEYRQRYGRGSDQPGCQVCNICPLLVVPDVVHRRRAQKREQDKKDRYQHFPFPFRLLTLQNI